MFEIRFHGRGGQGAVMAAQALAEAAVLEGLHAQAFPYFGAERRGAPVMAFARVFERKITIKSQIYEPDMLVILDETLLDIEPVAQGLKADGTAIVNSKKRPEDLDLGKEVVCGTVNANAIAMETLKAPIVNTAILGAIARMYDTISLEMMLQAIENRFGEKFGERGAQVNMDAARLAYERTVVGRCQGKRPIVQKKMWLPTWEEIPMGVSLPTDIKDGILIGPGGARQNLTGTWRLQTPRYLKDKCIRCLRCWFSCPEGCIKREEDDHVHWDLNYCKGCGICAQICPVNAVEMVKGVEG